MPVSWFLPVLSVAHWTEQNKSFLLQTYLVRCFLFPLVKWWIVIFVSPIIFSWIIAESCQSELSYMLYSCIPLTLFCWSSCLYTLSWSVPSTSFSNFVSVISYRMWPFSHLFLWIWRHISFSYLQNVWTLVIKQPTTWFRVSRGNFVSIIWQSGYLQKNREAHL